MSTDVVIVTGPMSTQSIARVQWQRPTTVIGMPCNPPSSERCPDMAAALGPTPIQRILATHGVTDPGRICIMGFSAAHAVLEHVLSSDDADQVDVLGAWDAYFTGPGAPIKPGYLRFCERAASGDALAIVTTSHNSGLLPDGTPYPPGDEAFARVAEAVGGLSAVSVPAGVTVPADGAVGRGSFIWANYAGVGGDTHSINANQYAGEWSQALIAPYLATGSAPDIGGISKGRRIFRGLLAGSALWGLFEIARRIARS